MSPSVPEPVADRNRAITVRELLDTRGEEWEIEILTGHEGLDRQIVTFELNRPGLALAGYYGMFSEERVQLLGMTELEYLASLSEAERRGRIYRTMQFQIPCVIITRGLPAMKELIDVMGELQIPLLRTTHITTPFQAEIGQYLERQLAPRWNVHGVMTDIYGLGVLIQGKSGIGKSETGLELVQRGHLLVADDAVQIRRVCRGKLFAEPSEKLGFHMELRGIGIVDVELMYGVQAVKEESEIELVIELEKWQEGKEYERLGLDERYIWLFDCKIPHIILPVEPGRNMAQIIEVAALMQRLKLQGIDVASDFATRFKNLIKNKTLPNRPPISRK